MKGVESLIAAILQAGPVLAAMVGGYMAIRVELAKLSTQMANIITECQRIDAEVNRIRQSMDRRAHAD